MKRILPLFLFVTAIAWAGPARLSYEPASRIDAVTVFLDRALVTRTATVDVAAGESTVILNLPTNLWDNSLQVSGTGPDGTTLLDVQSRNHYVEATPNPLIHELEQKVEVLRRDERALRDEFHVLDRERKLVEQIIGAATTVPDEGGNALVDAPDKWSQLLSFSTENNQRLDAAQRAITLKQETLLKKIAAAQAQLDEARGHQPHRRAVKEVAVRIDTPVAGQIALTIGYTVPGAHWTPHYRARLDSTTREVALDYEARVMNRTGEDWSEVALTLSTARPSAGGSAPEAMPWIVEEMQYARPEPIMTAAGLNVRESKMLAAPAMMAERMDDAIEFSSLHTTVDSGLTAATFSIAAPATIPADGTQQKVKITTLTLPAGLRYDTTPKYNAAAFLTAKVSNDSDFPLLAGQLAAFVDGTFIADSYLETTLPTEDFELALGVDDAVVIERTLVNRFVEKTGLTNSGTRVTYEIALEVTNHKPGPITLQLAEPLPVSRHEKIIVKLLSPPERQIGGPDDTSAFKRDEEGILTWMGSLAPGATKDITLKFSIEHPNSLEVTGVE